MMGGKGMRKLFFVLLACFPLFSLLSSEMDNEVSYIYLKNALLTEDEDLSLSFLEKAYEFNTESSDVLYLLADRQSNLDFQTKISYLEKALELNNWVIFSLKKAMPLYWDLLISAQDYKSIIVQASSYEELVQETPDLLYPYMLVMRQLEMKKPLDEMIDLAWGRYLTDPRFWEFFIAREGSFLSFYAFLEEIKVIPEDYLPSLLYNLPKEEALRKAYLSLFESKTQEIILYAFLTLEGLYDPIDFLALLEEGEDLYYFDLYKKLYDFFTEEVKEVYLEWLCDLSGEFFWKEEPSILVNNFIKISNGNIVNWSYKGKDFKNISLFFQNDNPTLLEVGEGPLFAFEGDFPFVSYGKLYPFVERLSLEKNEVLTLSNSSFSFPLSIFSEPWSYIEEPTIFIPLSESLSKIKLKIEESELTPYLIKKEKFDDDSNLIYQADYLNGKLLRKAYKTNSQLSQFNFLEFYENGKLTSSLWDINGNNIFDIMVVYSEDGKTYILVDSDNDGQVDYIYYLNRTLDTNILDVVNNSDMDSFSIQQKIENLEAISIPIDSEEAIKWKRIPEFLRDNGRSL